MDNKTVKVKNICGHGLSIINEETRMVRRFSPDAIKIMDENEIRNLYFGDDGFSYMVREKYLQFLNPSKELAEELELDIEEDDEEPAVQWTNEKLVALSAEKFLQVVPTLREGEKESLESYLENNDFPTGLVEAAKKVFNRDFIKAKTIKADNTAKNVW